MIALYSVPSACNARKGYYASSRFHVKLMNYNFTVTEYSTHLHECTGSRKNQIFTSEIVI